MGHKPGLTSIAAHALLSSLLLLATVSSAPALAATDGWQALQGPPGASINALLVDPQQPHILLAGATSGLFRSDDGGATWQRQLDVAIQCLAMDSNGANIYAGTRKGQIHVSADHGQTWALLAEPSPHKIIWDLAPTDAGLLVGSDALYRVEASAWRRYALPTPATRVLAILCLNDTWYIGTDAGVWHTENEGETWQTYGDSQLPIQANDLLPIGDDLDQPQLLVATDQGLLRIQGTQSVTIDAPALQGVAAAALIAPHGDTGPIWVVLPTRGIAISQDRGQSWALTPCTAASEGIRALATDPQQPNRLYLGTGRGAYASRDDGATWQAINQGLFGLNVNAAISQHDAEPELLAATRWGVFFSSDGGTSWQTSQSTEPMNAMALICPSPTACYAGTWNSRLYQSADHGQSWTLIHGDVADGAPITALTWLDTDAPEGLLIAGTAGKGLYWSDDAGYNWQQWLETAATRPIASISCLLSDGSQAWAGTESGLFMLQDKAWQAVSTLPIAPIRAIQKCNGGWYVATDGQLVLSRDQGQTWTELESLGRYDLTIHDVACIGNREPVIYVSSDQGILVSHDAGQSWNWTLADQWVDQLTIDASSQEMLYAHLPGHGLWQSRLVQPRVSTWLWWVIGLIALGGAGVSAYIYRRHQAPQAPSAVETLENNWETWDQAVHRALMQHGRANETLLKDAVPVELAPTVLQFYLEVHPEKDLTWNVETDTLETDELNRIQILIKNWQSAQDNLDDASAFRAAASRIANQICSFMGFTRLSSRTYQRYNSFCVQGPTLRLRIPSQFPLIFSRQRDFTAQDIQDLRNLMDALQIGNYFALIFVFGDEFLGETNATTLRALAKETAHDFIVLEFNDLFDAITARRRERYLAQLLLRQVDLTVVSPYVTYGPVPENMFFGRDTEIKTIIRTIADQSFAIVGGRKIGKTSVLLQVNRSLESEPETMPFYLDCQAINTPEDLYQAAVSRWQVKVDQTGDDLEPLAAIVGQLEQQAEGKQVIILMDEIDGLLAHDMERGETLFRTMRAMSQENRCRFVLCGERLLDQQLRDAQSPLFNFCQILSLGTLAEADARQVVLEPMREMGVEIEDPDELLRHMIEITSGHPNLLQYLCQQMLVEINDQAERRINPDTLHAVVSSRYFADYAVAVAWGSATPLAKVISLFMLDQPLLTVAELETRLAQELALEIPPTELERELDHLVLCSFLDRQRQYYAYKLLSFPDLIEASQDVPALIAAMVQAIQTPPQNDSEPLTEGENDATANL